VNEAQEIAAAQGIDLRGRLCLPFRLDTMTKFAPGGRTCSPQREGGGCDWEGDMDGSFAERETVVKASGTVTGGSATSLEDATGGWRRGQWLHRLLILRPAGDPQEARRIVHNTARTLEVASAWSKSPLEGDLYEIRGSFDPDFIKRVPHAEHQESVRRFWVEKRNVCGVSAQAQCAPPAEPLDPYDARNQRGWPSWVDRREIEGMATEGSVPALYGDVNDADPAGGRSFKDPYYSASSVLMDVSHSAYRHWRIRYLLYKLQDFGLDPGEAACVIASYKPGLHTFHDEVSKGPPSRWCGVPGSHTWIGPAHVCIGGRSLGGPFNPTPYGRGEYEAGVNAFLQEMIDTLAEAGYPDLRVITAEKPAYGNEMWSILSKSIRSHPKVVGEWNPAPLDPPLPKHRPGGEKSDERADRSGT
jgi:hypothetical protein